MYLLNGTFHCVIYVPCFFLCLLYTCLMVYHGPGPRGALPIFATQVCAAKMPLFLTIFLSLAAWKLLNFSRCGSWKSTNSLDCAWIILVSVMTSTNRLPARDVSLGVCPECVCVCFFSRQNSVYRWETHMWNKYNGENLIKILSIWSTLKICLFLSICPMPLWAQWLTPTPLNNR